MNDCPEPFLVTSVVTGSVHTEPPVTCAFVSPDRDLSVVAPENDDPAPVDSAPPDEPTPVNSEYSEPADVPEPVYAEYPEPADIPEPVYAEPVSTAGNADLPFVS